jgi:membrane-bound metal-dependent hydrolase YbcI (DUF457 family)
MADLVLEILRAIIVGAIVMLLLFYPGFKQLNQMKGWKFFLGGFGLVLLGTLVDITDNFGTLNRFILIGDTVYQALIEKFFGYLLGFIFIAVGILSCIPRIIELQNRRKKELKNANRKIKILSGFFPICVSCKKLRDDKGFWNQIESYIREHSEAEFSHGICPECAKKLYPEFIFDS